MKKPHKDTGTPSSTTSAALLLLVLIVNAESLAVTIQPLCG